LLFLQLVAGIAIGSIVYTGNGYGFDASCGIVMKHTDALPRMALILMGTATLATLISYELEMLKPN